MKIFFSLILLTTSMAALAAPTCKIKMLDYTDSWLTTEMKEVIEGKGYTLTDKYDESAVDYTLLYELKTYGIYPCRISTFTCVGAKRFANLTLTQTGEEKPLIELEESHKKKEFNQLRELVEFKFFKQIRKLEECK